MIDLHIHSVFSDGELIPAEIIRRLAVLGFKGLAITDHADPSNLELIVPRVARACREIGSLFGITAVAGIELTHNPPEMIGQLVREARRIGAAIVVVHGETSIEPVAPGTNRAAIEAKADILAHPGMITGEDVKLAVENEVLLELSGRKGHCLSNGHVAMLAKQHGAGLVINSDSHAPSDFFSIGSQKSVGLGAGLTAEEVEAAIGNSKKLLEKAKRIGA